MIVLLLLPLPEVAEVNNGIPMDLERKMSRAFFINLNFEGILDFGGIFPFAFVVAGSTGRPIA
jgi:hypothetical protein